MTMKMGKGQNKFKGGSEGEVTDSDICFNLDVIILFLSFQINIFSSLSHHTTSPTPLHLPNS